MKKSILLFLVLFTGLMSAELNAQLEFPEDKVSWKFTSVQDGADVTVIGTITMVEHWHIYAANLPDGVFTLPTTLELEKSSNYKTVGGVIEPKPHFEHDELADEDLFYHSETIKLKRKIKVSTGKDFVLKGTFGFQTCDDTHCLPPYEADFELNIKGVKQENNNDEAIVQGIENTFSSINGDEAKDKNGDSFVKVDNTWHKVPEGNSATFYKKYISLGGSDEK